MRCSITGRAVTRPSAITPRPSTKRGRQWRNQVSTELEEGQYVLSDGLLYPLFLSIPLRFRHGTPLQCRPQSALVGFGNCCIGQQVFRSGRLHSRETRGNNADSHNTHSGGLANLAGQALFQYSGSFAYWGLSLTGHDESLSWPLSFCAPRSNGRFSCDPMP